MGGKLVVPEPDERVKKQIVLARLTVKELSRFWKYFKKLDKDKSNLVYMSEICKRIEAPRNLFFDALTELLEIDGESGRLTFGEFLEIVITYCLFEPFQILKYAFFVFDVDKDGFFTPEELKMLMNVLHNVKMPDTVKGSQKKAWLNLEIAYDNRVEFREFEMYHKKFPQLFEPAFQLQIKLIRTFMGERWWKNKKLHLQEIKDKHKDHEERKKEKVELRRERVRSNRLIARMGFLYYYACPCLRSFYIPQVEPHKEKVEEDPKKKREEEIKAAHRQADADIKNQETAEWQKFEQKINPEKGGDGTYVEQKLVKVQRARKERVESRKERKQQRANVVNDGFEKPVAMDDD